MEFSRQRDNAKRWWTDIQRDNEITYLIKLLIKRITLLYNELSVMKHEILQYNFLTSTDKT